MTELADFHLAYGAARETEERLVIIIKDGIKKYICRITLPLFSHSLTEINMWLKSGERAGRKAGHIYRNKRQPHCADTTHPRALTVEHFETIRVKCSLNTGENCAYLNAESKGAAR